MTGGKLPFLFRIVMLSALVAPSGLMAAMADPASSSSTASTPIAHLVVVMQENRTFDNYFGIYPGADGIPPNTCMPIDPNDPANTTCIKPFRLGDQPVTDLAHSQAMALAQMNQGKMDGFVSAQNQQNENGAQAMGYYDGSDLPFYWALAKNYVLFDRFFSSAANGSFINHMYSISASPGTEYNQTSSKGYADLPTIFDRLEERGVSWKFYVQSYDPYTNYRTQPPTGGFDSQVEWVPLLSIDRFINDPALRSHIVDLSQYFTDLENGTLPAVSYIAPSGSGGASEQPPGDPETGQRYVKSLTDALIASTSWPDSALLITWDDWGGWYDHVRPPQVDQFGYGLRVPGLLISAYARQGYIDSTELDFTSILKFIEDNWNISPLTTRDANANSFVTAFDFAQPPRVASVESLSTLPSLQPRRAAKTVIYIIYGAALLLAGLPLAWAAYSSPGTYRLLTKKSAIRRRQGQR